MKTADIEKVKLCHIRADIVVEIERKKEKHLWLVYESVDKIGKKKKYWGIQPCIWYFFIFIHKSLEKQRCYKDFDKAADEDEEEGDEDENEAVIHNKIEFFASYAVFEQRYWDDASC